VPYEDQAFGWGDTSRDNSIYEKKKRIRPFELYRKEDSARYDTFVLAPHL
jgi:hypothetical protein